MSKIIIDFLSFNDALKRKEFINAKNILWQMDEIFPNHVFVLDGLVRYHLAVVDYHNATMVAENALKIYKDHIYFQYYLALSAYCKHDYRLALSHILIALEHKPENSDFIGLAGDILAQMEQYSVAISLYQKAILSSADNFNMILKLAKCQYYANQFQEARENLLTTSSLLLSKPFTDKTMAHIADLMAINMNFDADFPLFQLNQSQIAEYSAKLQNIRMKNNKIWYINVHWQNIPDILNQTPAQVQYIYLPKDKSNDIPNNLLRVCHNSNPTIGELLAIIKNCDGVICDNLELAICSAICETEVKFKGNFNISDFGSEKTKYINEIANYNSLFMAGGV